MDVARGIALWYRPVLMMAAVLATASVIALWRPGLSNDYSLRAVAGSSTREFSELEQFVDEFSGVELALIVVRSESVLAPATNACLRQIVSQTEQLPAVDQVTSIAQAPAVFRRLLLQSSVVKGLLVSEDGKTAAVLLQMHDDARVPNTPRGETVKSLKKIVADAQHEFPEQEVVLTGPYVVSYEMTERVWEDLISFGMLGAVSALVVLGLSLGSLRLAIYPLLVGVTSVAIMLGLSVALGVNTAFNLPMLVLLSAVLTIANCVHLAVGHDETRGDAAVTVRRLLRPCCGVVATTVVGFAAIGVSAFQPVRTFALLMIFGLIVGLFLALAGAYGSLTHSASRALLAKPIHSLLRGTLTAALRRPRTIAAGFTLVGVASVAMTSQLEFNLRFLDNFRPEDDIRRNYEFVENALTPMQSMELLIDRKGEETALTPETVHAIRRVTAQYERVPPITRAVSVVDFLTFGGWELPDSQRLLDNRVQFLKSSLGMILGENPLAGFVGEESGALRVSFFAHDGPTVAEKIELGNEIQQKTQRMLGDEYDVRVTGIYYFYAHVANELLRDQAISLIASIIGVFVTMALVLKSSRMAAVGMAPPLFAGAACVGLMAIFKVPFNTVTSMMLAIALGIAVDDTIHYLWRYRVLRSSGRSAARSISTTHLSVGRACTLTSLVIAAGFAVMGFSKFLPIAYFGGVISAVMAIALAANLLLLPALVLIADQVASKR